MLSIIIQYSVISVVMILLLHYLYNFFKDTLTVPKVKDLIHHPGKQYEKIFELDNVSLEFGKGALDSIAEKAYESKTGARGLRTILEKILLEPLYDCPSQKDLQKVVINEKSVKNDEKPLYILRNEKKFVNKK